MLRDLIFKNFWLKLFSFVLAVLIWLTVSFTIRKESTLLTDVKPNAPSRIFYPPVLVMSAAADVREVRVDPSHVEVTVSGEADALEKLRDRDIRVLVDLTGIESADGLRKRVEVSTPHGVAHMHVLPEEVQIVIPPKPVLPQNKTSP